MGLAPDAAGSEADHGSNGECTNGERTNGECTNGERPTAKFAGMPPDTYPATEAITGRAVRLPVTSSSRGLRHCQWTVRHCRVGKVLEPTTPGRDMRR